MPSRLWKENTGLIDEAKLRAWWSFRQGLDGSLKGKDPAEVLNRSGWARSVGGASPYLTLFSRGGVGREQADLAVANLEIHELPSARGCTYVVPKADFALALKVGEEFSDAPMKTARKLGVTDREVDKLCNAVIKTLGKSPMDPDQIREATGNASRSMGEEGKKKGLTTTLPLALGKLQVMGEIRRIPVNGRLDQQRYKYTLWRPNPLEGFKLSVEEAYVELARRFFRWTGAATTAEFQWFSGLGVKVSKAALEPLQLVPVEKGSDRLMFPEDKEAFASFKPPLKPQYCAVGCLDSIYLLRRDVKGLLDRKDLERKVFNEKTLVSAGGLTDFPNHAILDRGRLIGLWEYDTEKQSIAWMSFDIRDKALIAVMTETESFIREQVGDARTFSLDSPKSRAPRIEALRKAAGQR